MDYGNKQEKEQRSPWLAIRFGCCASKEDAVDDGREALRATGMYYFTCLYSQNHVYFFLHNSLLRISLSPSLFVPVPILHRSVSVILPVLLRCTTHLACAPLNSVNARLYLADLTQHPSKMLVPKPSIEHQTNCNRGVRHADMLRTTPIRAAALR
jgi:hypothetical protein